MKRGDFSYTNGHSQSHASLGRLRNQNHQSRAQSITRDMMYSKPNVKYYSNQDGGKTLHKKTINHKSEEQLKQRVKQLQFELKKKITQNCYLVKLFKTKNSAQVSHIDIYLQMRQLEQSMNEKDQKIQELTTNLQKAEQKIQQSQEKIQELGRQIEDVLADKDEQQRKHTNQIQTFSFQIDEYQKKCRQQLIEKDKRIQQQKKMRQEKDVLLKQIKKHYEESKEQKIFLNQQLSKYQQNMKEIQSNIQQSNAECLRQLQQRISSLQDQLEKSVMREQQKQAINEQLNKKCEYYECLHNKARKVAEEKTQQVLEKMQEIKQYQKKCQQLHHQLSERQQIIRSGKQEKETQIQQFKLKISQLQMQVNNKQAELVNNAEQKANYNKQLGSMQQKILELQAKIKILTFEKEEREMKIIKLSQKMEKQNNNYNTIIEQLETKVFTAEKRAHSAMERLKEQQKENKANKQKHETVTTKQIQIYKAMGRLTELSHHVKSLYVPDGFKVKKMASKQINEREAQNITECVDMVAQELEIFFKHQYFPMVQQSKKLKEIYEETLCNMKDLLHSYNNYVQDQQLRGITRQFIQVAESMDNCTKKQRNTYLHMLIERLISMTAIKSYTSENGQKRTHMERQPKQQGFIKNYQDDSLQNTIDRHNDEQANYEVKPYARMERQNSSKLLNRNRYDRETRLSRSKLNTGKIYTEPDETICVHPSRKLEFDKENLMNRINRKQQKTHMEGIKQFNSNNSIKTIEQQSSFFKDKHSEIGLKGKISRAGSVNNGYKVKSDQNSGYSQIEKKYYR